MSVLILRLFEVLKLRLTCQQILVSPKLARLGLLLALRFLVMLPLNAEDASSESEFVR